MGREDSIERPIAEKVVILSKMYIRYNDEAP